MKHLYFNRIGQIKVNGLSIKFFFIFSNQFLNVVRLGFTLSLSTLGHKYGSYKYTNTDDSRYVRLISHITALISQLKIVTNPKTKF